MTDAELVEFCNELEKRHRDLGHRSPMESWNEECLVEACIEMTRAARDSVALRAHVDTLIDRAARAEAKVELLRHALDTTLRSARPNPTEHPTMTAAWAAARAALAATEPDVKP